MTAEEQEMTIDLPEVFRQGGFTLERILLDGRYAIYRQIDSSGSTVSYELHRARPKTRYKTSVRFWGTPTTNDWGTHGWTLPTCERAVEKLNGLLRKEENKRP